MESVFLVGGMALVTFGIRYVLLPFSGRIQFSGAVRRALGYVPPAVLTAIIVPMSLMPGNEGLQVSASNPYLVGAVATAAIAWWSKNLLATVVGGMAIFLTWKWLLPTGWLGI